MKTVVNSLYWSAVDNLQSMKKSEMTLCERIKYEKALAQLDAMKKIIDQYNLQP